MEEELVALADATMVDWLHSSASPIRSRPIVSAYDYPRLCEARGKRRPTPKAGRFSHSLISHLLVQPTQLCAAGLRLAVPEA